MPAARALALVLLFGASTPAVAGVVPTYFRISVTASAEVVSGPATSQAYDSLQNAPLGLTSKAVSASVTGSASGGGPIQSASGTASANLSTGQLRASGEGSSACQDNTCNLGSGSGRAILEDTLRLDNASIVDDSTAWLLGLRFALDGSVEPGVNGLSDASRVLFLQAGQLSTAARAYTAVMNSTFLGGVTGQSAGGFKAVDVESAAAGLVSGTAWLQVVGRNPIVGFAYSLLAQGRAGGSSDYSSTASLSLVLPEGVTFTSDSGVFDAVAPLPGGLVLLLTAFGATVAIRFRASRASLLNLCARTAA